MVDSGLNTSSPPAEKAGTCRVCNLSTSTGNPQGEIAEKPGFRIPAWLKELLVLALAVAIGIGGYLLEHAAEIGRASCRERV